MSAFMQIPSLIQRDEGLTYYVFIVVEPISLSLSFSLNALHTHQKGESLMQSFKFCFVPGSYC